jgi:hypothetical protein
MWKQYRKTLWVTQIFILLLCLTMYFAFGNTMRRTLVLYAALQGFALLGAFWGANLKSRIEGRRNNLPLHRRGL